MKKRLISVILSLTLLLAATVPALASDYSDVNDGRWSVDYITDLARRGLLTGYDDGTFRPANPITVVETLAVLSRFYALSDEVKGWIYEDYKSFIESSISSSLSWAYDELSVCLAAGIISEDELVSTDLTSAIEKELFAVLLVRTMKLEKTAFSLADTELDFNDAADIKPAHTGHVALLVSLEVVTGNDSGNFLPHSGVTREVAAAMLSRSLDYLEGSGIALNIEAYTGLTKTQGLIYSVNNDMLRLRLYNGLIREYTVPSTASVTVNGSVKALNPQYKGCHVLLTSKDGIITKAEIVSDPAIVWVQGNLASVVSATAGYFLTLSDFGNNANTRYNPTANTVIRQEGNAVACSALTTSNFITLKLVDNVLTELDSYSSDCEINGEISVLDYGTVVTLKITDDSGAVWYFPLDISSLPSITRGETVISVDRLSVGDKVSVTVDNGKVKSIASKDSENTITGELLSITTTTDATSWVIKDKEGKSWTLKMDENASVYSGSTAILLSAISAGAVVKVSVFGDTINEVYLISAASSSSKVTGTVLALDSTKKIVTVLVSGKLMYINASSTVSIIKSSTGRTIGLTGLTNESTVVAYGSYSNSVNFNAVLIILES